MKAAYFATLAVSAAVVSAAPLEVRNNDGKKTSAGGTGPNPSVPGDGGNGLTVTVIDPTGDTAIDKPVYRAITDFDYASFNLGLYQEWIELDLFNYGLKAFSVAEFEDAGMTQDYRDFLQFMANQETGHAQLLTNILGPGAAPQCTYNYTGAFTDVRSYLEFNALLTRWGESGVWGFLAHLDSRPSAALLSQSIATEARQQMAFRQFLGVPGMDVYFEPGIPQAWAWTLLAPWIQSCPSETPRIGWSNYASLTVDNNPSLILDNSKSAVSTNISRLVSPGDKIEFSWIPAGEKIGPNKSYTTVSPGGSTPKYALWAHQLNATYAPLTLTSETTGYAYLPKGDVYDTDIAMTGPYINGTGFVALVNDNPVVTPYNLSLILPHMVAGPAVFIAG